MLRYVVGGLLVIAAAAGISLFVLARLDDGDAEAGPAREIVLGYDGEVVFPSTIDVARGEAIELLLHNGSDRPAVLRIADDAVEALTHTGAEPGVVATGDVAMITAAGSSRAVVVRFVDTGAVELRIEPTVGSAEASTVAVIVR